VVGRQGRGEAFYYSAESMVELTIQEVQYAEQAAGRWGKQRPSFMDVLGEIIPDDQYQSCKFKRERWSLIKNHALEIVAATSEHQCPFCGGLVQNPAVNTYCSRTCGRQAANAGWTRDGERCCARPDCTVRVHDKRQKYCSAYCRRHKDLCGDCGAPVRNRSLRCKDCADKRQREVSNRDNRMGAIAVGKKLYG